MRAFHFRNKKEKSIRTRSTDYIKIAISGLLMASLLGLSIFAHFVPEQTGPINIDTTLLQSTSGDTDDNSSFSGDIDQNTLAKSPDSDTSVKKLPQNNPSAPASAVLGSRLLYTTISKVTGDREPFQFTISAADADGDELFYSASNLPEGASFDADTRTFSWTPRYDQAGAYSVHFEVSDGQLTDSENVIITIVKINEDWDINGDDTTNVLDMVLVGQHWDETGLTGWIREDANEDGTVSVLDMIVIGQHWTI
jgi:hypothetical protein